ncbi:hypothetical protein RJT34_14061 [Clitoria ternatea]|uniref:SAGA-associated factor 11 n=1 Tax=Clitoria ternatea TaxID=43366 RepID=A0AAN9JPQ4_CLITE
MTNFKIQHEMDLKFAPSSHDQEGTTMGFSSTIPLPVTGIALRSPPLPFPDFSLSLLGFSMVCSPGGGRMQVMARLLASGSFSQTVADDCVRQKSAAEYICRELREADEANLLHEEDMHVYGERPMADPLQLVCCNICKKPIKDSQFAAHAELCKSLKVTEKTTLELDGSTRNRKPPRKEKKKLSTSRANQATAVGERRRSESVDNIDSALSQPHLNGQIRLAHFSNEVKDAASMMDGTGIDPGNRDHPASVMHPPTKRHKLIRSTHLPILESHGTESGVTKTVSFTDKNTHVPAPLATKVYYSQRTNRLRATIHHLYFQDLNEEMCTDVCPKTSHAEMVAFQDSSERDPSFDQMDNVHNMGCSPAQNSDHILTKTSEICLLKAGGMPSGSLSDQFLLDNVSRSSATHVGLTRSNFLPSSYSFSSSTGNALGTMQQPSGSVPVI